MKIAICYPPLENKKGAPLLSQNRQFQWFSNSLVSYAIYPVVMASMATLLQTKDHQVAWLDGIAKKWSFNKFLKKLKDFQPDLVVIETKTPVVKKHWQILKKIQNSKTLKFQTAIVGDHVSSLPEESLQNSPVDFVLTGGDYDFAILNLVNYLKGEEKLAPGVWYQKKSKIQNSKSKINIKNTGKPILKHNLNSLPLIDRDLTCWRDYAYKNSNFYRAPGAYTMFARDCWWGKCTFCSWAHNLYPVKTFRTVPVEKALNEIGHLIKNYHIKEIMDDSGTFPVGDWLRNFCRGMIERGYNKKIKFNCNMRFNTDLTKKDYQLMGQAGFRFLLYGLESANQKTLDKIDKNLKIDQVEEVLQWATEAKMMPHVTVMIGWPWEKESDIKKTINFVKNLFKKGLIFTMQATIVIPYPGTPLFAEAKKKGWLKTQKWADYDMRKSILKIDISDQKLKSYIQSLFSSFATPQFIWRTISSIRNFDDIKYITFQGLKFISKKMDFKK